MSVPNKGSEIKNTDVEKSKPITAHSTEITQIAAATSTSTTTKTKRRIESMSDEEIIQENLQELLEKKSREERKANGRLIAVIVAFLVIFLAIYHAWIRNSKLLAGVIVPAVIMLSYGGWVVVLAKRDKRRRAMFERHLEEVALRNKTDVAEKSKIKLAKKEGLPTLFYENEKPNGKASATVKSDGRKHQKHRRHRRAQLDGDSGTGSGSSTSSSRTSSSHHPTKHLRTKRPSIRQKLFRQNATINLFQQQQQPTQLQSARPAGQSTEGDTSPATQVHSQRSRPKLQRLDALVPMPPLVRMGSAP